MINLRVAPIILACVLGAASAQAADDAIPWFHESVSLKAGAIFSFIDTDVEINGNDIDLESDLDLDEFEVLPSLEARWRFSDNRKHRLELGYFSVLRSDTRNLSFDLDLPDSITITGETRTKLNVHIVTLTYGYSLLLDERKELGLFAGLDFIIVDASVRGTLSVFPNTEIERDLTDENFKVPFPTAGVYFNWAFSDRLGLLNRFQYFGLKFGDVEGSLFRGNVRLQHRTFRHVDFFIGYDVLGSDVELDSSVSEVSLVYHGPIVGLEVRF